jgi:putative transposase
MTISLFQQIIKSLPRRKIDRIVATHKSDKWCKKFSTFDQLIVMIFAQLSGQTSLRDLEASFNASPTRHHHMRADGVKRSTLSDANAARPCGVFEAILAMLLSEVSTKMGRKIGEMVEILDSTTLTLFAKTHKAMRFRSNNSAIKLHLMFDPDAECPTWFQITPARFHDSKVCDDLPLAARTTYVFDRAYNNSSFWADIQAAGAFFVTRPKSNLAYDVVSSTHHPNTMIVADEVIILAGNPGKKYTGPLRRIEIFDADKGREIAFISNDFSRSAEQIANLYKRRWQIELFFKWIKQNLKIKRFLAKNPKAIRLQIITALIAHVLLKKLHHHNLITIPLKRVAALASNYLFALRDINQLIKPPDKTTHQKHQNQLALNFPGQ